MRLLGCKTVAFLLAAIAGFVLQTSHGEERVKREAPRFEPDPSWPKIPNGWVFGQVFSAAADEQGNIWVLHRPRSVRPAQKAGPPVMEFDSHGNYLQGWGSEDSSGAYTLPQSEHGIYVGLQGTRVDRRSTIRY
jgi:hypothetical protein